MGDVINLYPVPNTAPGEWMEGPAICLCCKAEFVCVLPIGTLWFTCPNCETERATHKLPISRGGSEEFVCDCGNTLFCVNKTLGLYCPNCGQTVRPY